MADNNQNLPASIDSERMVLACCIVEGRDAVKRISHILTYKDFYEPRHSVIYRVVEYLYREQKDIDVITVSEFLSLKGYLDTVGGASYLTELTIDMVSMAHLVTHARIVADRAVLRRIIETSQQIANRAYSEDDLDKFLLDAESMLKNVTRASYEAHTRLNVVDLEEWREIARQNELPPGTVKGLSSGFKGIDDITEGFEPGEMYILTGHTKHGKSQLATNWAINVAQRDHTVLFINTEMTKIQMARRVNNILGEEPLKGKIILNDRADINHRDAIAIMENAKEKGCDMVVIDHLHYFVRSIDNATGEVSKMTKDFKNAAVTFELPLLMLCHVDQSKPETIRPTVKMLKNSSSIAQDSDMVLTVFRNEEKKPGVMEVIRLLARSTATAKKYAELYFTGLKLTEQKPSHLAPPIHNYYEVDRDETDLSDSDWTNDTSPRPVISTD